MAPSNSSEDVGYSEQSREDCYGGFQVYPTNREHPLKTATMWMLGKRADDNCGNLWRIHDKLYDFASFMQAHPGGEVWLQVTRGSDITEAFESAHLNPSVEKLLQKYYVADTSGPRISPYTFKEGGFYKVLKSRAYKKLQELGAEKSLGKKSVAAVHNVLLLTLFTLFVSAAAYRSYWLAALTGIVLTMNINCAHNFFHQRDNWRMYTWDLSLLSSYEWRITHALSHHLFTNSIYDFELSDFEPFFDFKVHSKNFLQRYGTIPIMNIISWLFFFVEFVKRLISLYQGLQKPRVENFFPLLEFFVLYGITRQLSVALTLWLVIHAASSYWFGLVGLIAAHHHPDIFHAGDELKYGLDWGLCQMDAVRDRRDVNGVLLAELTMYGQHVLHHLFPTLDHGELRFIEPVFHETCKEFGIDDFVYISSPYNQWDLFLGMFQQLARISPRKIASKEVNKKST